MNRTMIRCTFYTPADIIEYEYTIDWLCSNEKRGFASDADIWLRKGPGYRVEAEAV